MSDPDPRTHAASWAAMMISLIDGEVVSFGLDGSVIML